MAQGKAIIINYNNDFEETMTAFASEDAAMKDLAATFDVEETPDGKLSQDFLSEVEAAYGMGRWKGLNIQVLDLQSLDLDSFAPGCLDEDGPEPA